MFSFFAVEDGPPPVFPLFHRQPVAMPRVLTQRELNNVQDLIDSKMWYWNIALGLTDVMSKNPRHAVKIRGEIEDGGHVFDLARKVEGFVTMEPYLLQVLSDLLATPSPRLWKHRFFSAHSATAISTSLTVEKVRSINRWPDHVALYALKEIGRTLSELRECRNIPEPCEYDDTPEAEYLYNIDPLEPLAREECGFTTLKVSEAMMHELMDNPEGIENVIFLWDAQPYRIVAGPSTLGPGCWEMQMGGGKENQQLGEFVMEGILEQSYFVLQ